MMKVLFLTSVLEKGGISNVVFNEAKFLNKDFNIETTIATLNIKIDFHENVKIVRIEDNYRLKKLIDEHDIIHIHDGTPILLRLKKFDLKKPLIATFHGFPPWYMHQGVREKIEVLVLKLLYPRLIKKLADEVVAISGYVKSQLSNWGISSKVIYQGIDHEFFKPLPINKDNSLKKLLYVGSGYKYKSLYELVKIVGNLITRGGREDLHLFIRSHIQRWDVERAQKYVYKHGLESNIKFLNTPYSQISEVYNAFCDIFVTLSRWEGFGLPVLEAMSCGKPVICRSIPIFRELVSPSNAGIMLPERSSEDMDEEMEKAIYKIFENYESYSENALKYSFNFSWHKHVEELMEIYTKYV
jgi:glycosyltransferase involved in cell wall biosynthesis